MRQQRMVPTPDSPGRDTLAQSGDRLRAAVDDWCYALDDIAQLAGWSLRYVQYLTRLPPERPRHLATIGPARARRVPVKVWRAYLQRDSGEADTTLVGQPSITYTTKVTSASQEGNRPSPPIVPSGHRGRPEIGRAHV